MSYIVTNLDYDVIEDAINSAIDFFEKNAIKIPGEIINAKRILQANEIKRIKRNEKKAAYQAEKRRTNPMYGR